ncbi:hypothetical protein [Pinibacter soli]|uniref:UbiA prenyltransferase family protein n=1 Tax=Pinibacter soli TaxID=3044211 RepID=A0ABT6R9X7_9BACT|nr:hypothetical protein [Pinibacter soli]MDI3319372.1 hypothetical protein [Pinibacter soli]
MLKRTDHSLMKFIFFGNYFYGLCAIALSIEASLQQEFPLNTIPYYLLVAALTILYYTKAYITDNAHNSINVRSIWYAANAKLIFYCQLALYTVCLVCGLIVFPLKELSDITVPEWFLIASVPAAGLMYYGVNLRTTKAYNLRSVGWLKPFMIGFVWAGMVTIYPVLYYCITHNIRYDITWIKFFLFAKNFMYITVLCILFDIKDYATDHNLQLKTFVVKAGLRKTIFYIVIPLSIVGLGSFIVYALGRHFGIMKILMNTIPFILLILVAYSLHNRRSIFYYLVVIDGLMLAKALCGIVAMKFF